MSNALLRRKFNFFRSNAGYCVGENARGALALARAEMALDDAIEAGTIVVRWDYDPDTDYSFVDDWTGRQQRDWHATEHTSEGCILIEPCQACIDGAYGSPERCRHATVLGSLWGIIDASNEYRRIVAAELALEAGLGQDLA